MQFRLRTLLIVITTLCVLGGYWTVFMRQFASNHRRRAASIAYSISRDDHIYIQKVDKAIRRRAEGTATERSMIYGKLTISTGPDGDSLAYINSDKWREAVYHERMAATYDRAILKPWTLLETRPAR